MPDTAGPVYGRPDTTTALPPLPFTASRAGRRAAEAFSALEPAALFHSLLRDQESEASFLTARRILDAFLTSPLAVPVPAPTTSTSAREADSARDRDPDRAFASGSASGFAPTPATTAPLIAAQVADVRETLAPILAGAMSASAPSGPGDAETADVREAVLRQRAPLGLIASCWLDTLSQPATQPSIIVNRLFAQQWAQRGGGDPLRATRHLRRRALERGGVRLPQLGAADFLARARARPLTALHGCFYLALSRLAANFLPEVVGVHYAFHTLGVDDLLLGTEPTLPEPDLRAVLAEYLGLARPEDRARTLAAVRLTLALEREHVQLLADLADRRATLPLESRVAEIVARHAPYAGNQHQKVRVGGRLLAEAFSAPDFDPAAFLAEFREARQVQGAEPESARFIRAIKFGGPMFGIFDEREAALFKAWVASAQAGERPPIEVGPDTSGDDAAARWREAIARSDPSDVVVAAESTGDGRASEEPDQREFFHRLVNIENFPGIRPLALERAQRTLAAAEVLFEHGAQGRYTDATYFDYSPEALYRRAEAVYFEKLVKPFQPLEEVPDREETVFLQTTYALGALIDGTWLHRLATTGHCERPSDEMLFSIYADEMGHGELAKNHLTLIHRALSSMDVKLPHVREAAFKRQGELPDELYGFSLHQLCLAMFPDRFYNELLGYNLAIEMFGLGELRLHEIQKLRHHGFDDCYEQAHLTIDNISAGHTRQAADIIVAYLDGVGRAVGDAVVQQEWRRIWRGYASYAYFVEHALLKRLAAAPAPAGEPQADLVI